MLDLSQTELGNALGISFQQVQKYEKGTNRISASRLQQIASFLQVPISFFFEGLSISAKGSTQPADEHALADIFKFAAIPHGLSLIKAFMQIEDPKRQRRIVHLVEKAARKRE